jgi:hypothetical protein
VPSFGAFGRFLEQANPFAFSMEAARLAWFPWLAAAYAAIPPPRPAPAPWQVGRETVSHSSERSHRPGSGGRSICAKF